MHPRPTSADLPAPGWFPASWKRSRALLVLAAVALVAILGGWAWWLTAPGRAIHQLPTPERSALFARTMDNVRTVCLPAHASGLDAFCDEQASLLITFPECGPSCVALADQVRPLATR